MNLADQPSVPFIQSFKRNVYPNRVVWRQSTLLQTRFYWLELAPEQAVKDATISASIAGQSIQLETDISSLKVLLSDEMLNLDEEVTVELNGTPIFDGPVPRTILTLTRTLADREDPGAAFSAEVMVR